MLSQDWYTPQDLAAELGVSYRTILNAIAIGELVGYRIGRGEGRGTRIRITARDAEEWLERHCRIEPRLPALRRW